MHETWISTLTPIKLSKLINNLHQEISKLVQIVVRLPASTSSPAMYWKILFEPENLQGNMPEKPWHPQKSQVKCWTGLRNPIQLWGSIMHFRKLNIQNRAELQPPIGNELRLNNLQAFKRYSVLIQKHPFKGALRTRCFENVQQIYRRTLMPKYHFNKVLWNFIETTFRHGCSPVIFCIFLENFVLRTPLKSFFY